MAMNVTGNDATNVVCLRVAAQESINMHVRIIVALEQKIKIIVDNGPEAAPSCFQGQAIVAVGARAVQQASLADWCRAPSITEDEDKVTVVPLLRVARGRQARLATRRMRVTGQHTDE